MVRSISGFWLIMLLFVTILGLGCQTTPPTSDSMTKPSLLLSLPAYSHNPDGMTLHPKSGDIIVASPNFSDRRYPGVLMRIDPQNNLSPYFVMPVHPDTQRAGPMGMDFGPDGHLYVADNQYFFTTEHQSRLMRVNIEKGVPVSADVVVDGFKLSNGVLWRDNVVYVTDTLCDLTEDPAISTVYRFTLDELQAGPIQLQPWAKDPHVIAKIKTVPHHREDIAGADGLAMDKQGRLYVSSFGDGRIHRLTFDKAGNVMDQSVFVSDPRIPCSDGIFFDERREMLYVADSERNAIHAIDAQGKINTLWVNENTNGQGGLLDQPCEVLVRGSELIISSFDMPVPGLANTEWDAPHTMSTIQLP